ncbi:hypothetical protein [Clostridioides sp. ZZV15-6598]|uniref:hypothetical protein n=1 Tax=Clostridioides sp. ZZV15-6598 TaxID=2811501 RepID=UPI001D106EBF|nr:hypothetical protein [Clostridioides sp. ZZV15-6598]
MEKYKVLTDKLKQVFNGFYIDYENEDFPYIDLDRTDKIILNERYFKIDSFPKTMDMESPHSVLDVFWDLDKVKDKYFIQENKFLRALLIIMSYSKEIIIASEYFVSENKKHIKKVLSKKESIYLEQLSDTLFDFKEIGYNYYIIDALMKLSLRERASLSIYMLDLEIALEVNGLFSNVYMGLNGSIDTVKYICNVEGLYVR